MIVRPALGSLPNASSFRGQPLAIMLAVLALWIGLRASVWAPPPLFESSAFLEAATGHDGAPGRAETIGKDGRVDQDWPFGPWRTLSTASIESSRGRRPGVAAAATAPRSWLLTAGPSPPVALARSSPAPLYGDGVAPTIVLPAQRFAWAATPQQPVEVPVARARGGLSEHDRVSGEAWLFVREGGRGNVGAGPLAPTYGGSQYGAVLRYGLALSAPHAPQVYLRATGAIESREADLAGGISIQPFPALPLRAHGELRLSRLGDRVELRPSGFVTAGVEKTLALGARVRGYAQAGYVGGEFATPFADASLVVERDAMRTERRALALGVGAWGGAQEGTSRLDTGPTASLDLPLGRGRVRLAADYRFRVAGDAEPSSGAALTLSTSF